MNNPIIKIHNAETGEVIEREMTAAEKEQYDIDKQKSLEIKALRESKILQRNAILERLGLTEEDMKLLFSGGI